MNKRSSADESPDAAEDGSEGRSGPLNWLTGDRELKRWLRGMILVGFALFFVLFFAFMIFSILLDPESFVIQKIEAHFAGTIGIAFAALAALFVVLLLQYSVGHIRFKGLGFEFEGASAPTILWLFCFLGVVAGMRMLWSL